MQKINPEDYYGVEIEKEVIVDNRRMCAVLMTVKIDPKHAYQSANFEVWHKGELLTQHVDFDKAINQFNEII